MQSPEEQARPEAPMRYADASNRRITSYNAIDYAYRDLGVSEVPLVLLQHFRGNLDNWDPALIDALAPHRRVVTFDNVGVAATSGTTPNTVEAMAHGAIAFIEAMSFERVDLLGFSIGSFVAQEIALIRPDLLQRVVLASSAPQGAAGMHGWAPEVIGAVGAPETTPERYISVFFAPTRHESRGGPAGRRPHLRRKEKRPRQADDLADPPGAIRRRVQMGHPEPLAAPTSRGHRSPGFRGERRHRPYDPAPLLVPADRASAGCAAEDLPGLGARFPFPAPQPVRRRCRRLPHGSRLIPPWPVVCDGVAM
jgi:pimeloyl-ACP methyl ester carboxylesterase